MVQKDSRREGKLALAVLARMHAKYVMQITSDPKIFDPRYYHAITADLIRTSKDIYRSIWAANNTLVKAQRKKLRRLVAKSRKGLIPKESVDESYRSWHDHASKGNSYKLISRMDKYYADLWRDNVKGS